MTSLNAEALLFLITIIWGVTFSFTKIGLQFTTPMTYLTLRFLIATIIVYLFFNKKINKISKETLKYGSYLGFFYAGGFILQTIGLNATTVTRSAFITGLSVVFTPIVYKIFDSRKISFWQKIGIFIALIGLIKFTNPSFNNINIGDLLTFISTFFWAFYLVYMNKYTEGSSSFEYTIQLVFLQFVVVLLFGFVGVLTFELSSITLLLNEMLIFSLIYNGILASILLTTIHTSVQKYTTPVKAALIFSLEPVFASIFAYIIFGEVLNTTEIFGAIILTSGIVISEFSDYIIIKNQ